MYQSYPILPVLVLFIITISNLVPRSLVDKRSGNEITLFHHSTIHFVVAGRYSFLSNI